MRLHTAIARELHRIGARTLFGVLGDGNLLLVDSFVREFSGTYVPAAHESGAVLMAIGNAEATADLGVATVTHGPALTNTVTALIEGVRNRLPVLLIAGDTPLLDREHLQNIAQYSVVAPTGAGFEQVRSPQTALEDLATAVRRARTERRPIVLNIPADFHHAEIDYRPVDQMLLSRIPIAPDPEALDKSVGIIATAARPVLVAGAGASDDATKRSLVNLAARLGAPIATTLKARDTFKGHPLNLGIFGTLSDEIALDVIESSDCVIVFGAGLNRWTTDSGALLRGKRVVQCDIERSSIGLHQPVDVGVLGDARIVADSILSLLEEAGHVHSTRRSDALAARLAADVADDDTYRGAEGTVDLRTVLRRLDALIPSDRFVVTDGGRFLNETWRLVHAPSARSHGHAVGFGALGSGMSVAIGAALANSNRPTLHITGDGGFMMGGLAEFNTAVRCHADLIVVVLNDGAYGAEYVQLEDRGVPAGISTFDWPDFAPVAEALGGTGVTVRRIDDLTAVSDAVSTRSRPVLIDVKLDPAAVGTAGR